MAKSVTSSSVPATSNAASLAAAEKIRHDLTQSINHDIVQLQINDRVIQKMKDAKQYSYDSTYSVVLDRESKVAMPGGVDLILAKGAEVSCFIDRHGRLQLTSYISPAHLAHKDNRSGLAWHYEQSDNMYVRQLGKMLGLPTLEQLMMDVMIWNKPIGQVQSDIKQKLVHRRY